MRETSSQHESSKNLGGEINRGLGVLTAVALGSLAGKAVLNYSRVVFVGYVALVCLGLSQVGPFVSKLKKVVIAAGVIAIPKLLELPSMNRALRCTFIGSVGALGLLRSITFINTLKMTWKLQQLELSFKTAFCDRLIQQLKENQSSYEQINAFTQMFSYGGIAEVNLAGEFVTLNCSDTTTEVLFCYLLEKQKNVVVQGDRERILSALVEYLEGRPNFEYLKKMFGKFPVKAVSGLTIEVEEDKLEVRTIVPGQAVQRRTQNLGKYSQHVHFTFLNVKR